MLEESTSDTWAVSQQKRDLEGSEEKSRCDDFLLPWAFYASLDYVLRNTCEDAIFLATQETKKNLQGNKNRSPDNSSYGIGARSQSFQFESIELHL